MTTALFRPELFERLTDRPWGKPSVCDAIRKIVADADGAFDPERLWPAEEWDAWMTPLPLQNLYVGAAGVVWALDELRRRGLAEPRVDLAAAALRVLAAWGDTPALMTGIDLPARRDAALLTGETGILLVAWRLAPSRELEDRLLARVRENLDNETNELMWGVPGTLLATRTLLDWTGAERWRDAWHESADALWRRRDRDGLWTQRLYGATYRSLGVPHGLAGNTLALLRGGGLLDPERRDTLTRAGSELLSRAAVLEDGLANWPLAEGADLVDEDDGEIRVQWCAGAPGIVCATAEYLDEELLLAGAELVWRAGPPGLEKGPCICHGTAGNGHALLKAFERTGDERWLERARRFAVHALEQVERLRAGRGRGRYSLWTGDVGVALYAADCIEGRSAYPLTG